MSVEIGTICITETCERAETCERRWASVAGQERMLRCIMNAKCRVLLPAQRRRAVVQVPEVTVMMRVSALHSDEY